MSPIRAAGIPPIITVIEPLAITSGGPTQVAMSPTRAAGIPPIRTVTAPGGRIGPPTCGTTPVTIGQVCMSPTLAAGGMAALIVPRRRPTGQGTSGQPDGLTPTERSDGGAPRGRAATGCPSA